MRYLLNAVLASAVLFYFQVPSAFSEEHPTTTTKEQNQSAAEHPQGDPKIQGHEHPKGEPKKHEQPGGDVKHPMKPGDKSGHKKDKKPGGHSSWNPKNVEQDLKAFIQNEQTKSNGLFVMKDEISQMDRQLTLDKIHTQKIVKLNNGTSFVCADFKDKGGDKVDVDFFMTPSTNGAVEKVDKVQIHKINGKERYTYVQKNGSWVQQTVIN